MLEVRIDIHIARPAPVVFGVVSDMAQNPRWQKGMDACTWTLGGPDVDSGVQVGHTYDQEAHFMGKPIISRFKVTEFDAGHRIRIETYESTMPLDITRSVVDADRDGKDGGCRVQAIIRGAPQGLMRLFNPLMKPMVRKNIERDYTLLKRMLEAGELGVG